MPQIEEQITDQTFSIPLSEPEDEDEGNESPGILR